MSIRWPDRWPLLSMGRPPRAALWPLRCPNHSANRATVTGWTSSFRDGAPAPDPEARGSGFDALHRPGMTSLTTSSPHTRRDILLLARPAFGRHRPLIPLSLLQPGPIGCGVRAEILGEPDRVGEPQRVADDDVGHGEAAGAQRLGVGGRGLDGPKPAEKPFRIVGCDLRIAPLFRFQLAVTQHQRLRKSQRRVTEIHPVQ